MSAFKLFIKDIEKLKRAVANLPRIVGNEAVQHFKDGIDAQTDTNGKPYTQRRYTTQRQRPKKILKDRHNLYDSIKILSITNNTIVVGTEIEYAEAHNEGAEIPITPAMKRYFWAMYTKNKGKVDASFYKNLATKKTAIKIPQRQFIGESPALNKRLEGAILRAIKDASG